MIKRDELMIFKFVLLERFSYDIIINIFSFINQINYEYNKFDYVYKNITYINIDDYIVEIIKDINIKYLLFKNINNKLEYDNNMTTKLIYVTYICSTYENEDMIFIANYYLTVIDKYGDKFSRINASLTALKFKNMTDIKFDYNKGLLLCLNQSSKWDDMIYTYHDKNVLYGTNIYDIVANAVKYLYKNINLENNEIILKDILNIYISKGLKYINFISLFENEDDFMYEYVCDNSFII